MIICQVLFAFFSVIIKLKMKNKTIVYVGGGSGGHVAPLLAIHKQIVLKKPKALSLRYILITDAKFFNSAKQLFKDSPEVQIKKISAGKYRRHPNVSLKNRIKLIGYYSKNIADIFRFGLGLIQSFFLMLRLRPTLTISKGGYVAVPVVFNANLFKSKIIIHDSDTRPGAASKLTAQWADKIFTGFDTKYYAKSEWVGVPINETKEPSAQVQKFSAGLKLNAKFKTVLIVGGGNGSLAINNIVEEALPKLLSKFNIIHQAGEGKQIDFKSRGYPGRYIQFGFCPQQDMFAYLKLSDVVISRAGATSIQELAFNKKASIIISNPYLGDQIKNIKFIESMGAALSLDQVKTEDNPDLLVDKIDEALRQSAKLSESISKIYKPGAASRVASEALALL